MLEALTPEANPQLVHAREVALGVLPRAVPLGEENLTLRTIRRPPATNPPLQRAQLAVGIVAQHRKHLPLAAPSPSWGLRQLQTPCGPGGRGPGRRPSLRRVRVAQWRQTAR